MNNQLDNPLKGKIALVTAASSGIGYACAEALSVAGARVIVCSHSKTKIHTAAKKINQKSGNEVFEYSCDLNNKSEIESLVHSVTKRFKKIEIIVYNHGNPLSGSFEKISLEEWESSFTQILMPAIILTEHFIPIMKKNRWGRIFLINSIFAKEPDPNYIISSTFRAALLAYAKCLSKDFAMYNITINSILPGYIDTPLIRELLKKESLNSKRDKSLILKSWLVNTPVGKLIKPNSIGDIICYISTQKYPIITGSSISIDGGYLNSI